MAPAGTDSLSFPIAPKAFLASHLGRNAGYQGSSLNYAGLRVQRQIAVPFSGRECGGASRGELRRMLR